MALRHNPQTRKTTMMTTKDKVARRKLSLLELAKDLSNVSRACKLIGYSRQQFYEIRRNFQTYGADGLIDRLPGAKGPHPNRVAAEIEAAILDHALAHPCHGATRVEQELRLKGQQVSSGGVRGVWMRHNLLTKHERLLRLEKATAERTITLTEEQTRVLERFSPEFRERHIETPYTGALVAVDTFFVGIFSDIVFSEPPSDTAWLENTRRVSARSFCRPRLTAIPATLGPGSTHPSCRSPRCI